MSDRFDNSGITTRGWFRPAVAAWFALLLGGGLWLMPPDIHASIARTLALPRMAAMFEPPLGTAALAIVCGGFALLGAMLGWVIAARLAAASAPRAFAPGFEYHGDDGWSGDAEDDFDQPRRRRVFSAREDIGEEGIAISAPQDEDAGYAEEFTIEDEPIPSPEADFEAVYAGMDPDYVPPSEEDIVETEPVELEPDDLEYAEFSEVDEEPEAPAQEPVVPIEPGEDERPEDDTLAPEDDPEDDPEDGAEPLGDMSLDALLGRLENALDAHRQMVATSEQAASEPPPQTVPMMREPQDIAPGAAEDDSLPDIAEDDPVIAFLRREASRRMPPPPAADDGDEDDDEVERIGESRSGQTEAQAALRSALDRLGQVNRRD